MWIQKGLQYAALPIDNPREMETFDNNEAFGALSTDRICIQLQSCILMVYYQNL